MDRLDELKDNGGIQNVTRDDEDSVVRDEGILGITGSPVPKSPDDPTASNDPESVRHRRERALGEEVVERPADDQHGATGIDMGYGGHGTDVSGD
jgi:hypothetical protein